MPIPDFDHNDVLPPHLGDPRRCGELSPFPASSEEVCQRFATSPERRAILSGWLNFRQELACLGITSGFQWLDGSFLEDVEKAETRPPNDLDLITFFSLPSGMSQDDLVTKVKKQMPAFIDRSVSKASFHLDHFPVSLNSSGVNLVEQTRYWAGLFSHNRKGIWKGMLRIELNTSLADSAAMALLKAHP